MSSPAGLKTDSVSDAGVSVGDIFRMIRSHVRFILVCTAVALIGSIIYVSLQPPVYEATATVRIDPGRADSLGLSDLAGPSQDPDTIHTEIAIIKSDGVAVRTINSLDAQQFAEFANFSKEATPIPENSEEQSPRQAGLVGKLQSHTIVKQEEGTQLLQITVRDQNPQVAATLANRLVSSYEQQSFSSRDNSVAQLRNYLGAQINDLKNQVQTSQKKLADFQRQNNIIATSGARTSITDRLDLLSESLTRAQVDRITKEAQMKAALTGDPVTLVALFPNAKLQALQSEQATLDLQYTTLSTKFGAKYPPLVEVKKELQQINSEIASTIQSLKNQLTQQYQAANATQGMLQGEYDQQAKLAYGLNQNQAEYDELQADVTSSRELYETLQRKLQQAAVNTQVNSIETVLVDSARVPVSPVEPKKAIIILAGLILGLFAGIAAAFIFESTSDRVHSSDQIHRALNYPALAILPSGLPDRSNGSSVEGGSEAALITLADPLSRGAEAYRALRNAVVSAPTQSLKTLLFTCSTPGEELGLSAANFAVSLAQTGARVLVVDADLRQPDIHKLFGIGNVEGLGDYLSGGNEPTLKQPVKSLQNLSVVTSGSKPALPAEALGSVRFADLLQRWQASYDYVVLKSAPLLIVSDALPLAGRADSTVLVTRYDVSHIAELVRARTMLGQSNARIAGFVLTGVPVSASVYAGQTAYAKEYYA